MDDQFEKDLKKRISEVFDNYKDTSGDEGWERLREKFPRETKKRPVAWLWWSSAAAVVLVFLGIFWLKQAPEKHQQFTALKKQGVVTPSQTPASANAQKPGDSTLAGQPGHRLAATTDNNSPTRKTANASVITRTGKKRNEPATTTMNARRQRSAITSVAIASKQNNISDQNATNKLNNATAGDINPGNDVNPNNTAATAATKPDTAGSHALNANAIASAGNEIKQNSKPNNGSLAYNNIVTKPKGLPGDRRVRFGFYAATFFNYAKGSNSQFNIGAGITSDIRITKKLKLSTGIAIAQNSLSYGGQPVTPVPQGINLAPLALYSANTLQYSMSEPTFKSYNANLVGIDIPVNLKYTFDPGKTETYLLAGLSSGTFLNETYTYKFNGAPPFNPATHNNSGFYFGKTLNLAIGTGYRFGSNRVIIEPFLKYPLDGMGSQQIRFGSGGVNLKFNIPSIRK